MTTEDDISIEIDRYADAITIGGCRYAIELFRQFALAPIGSRLEIVARDDGVVTFRELPRSKEVDHAKPSGGAA